MSLVHLTLGLLAPTLLAVYSWRKPPTPRPLQPEQQQAWPGGGAAGGGAAGKLDRWADSAAGALGRLAGRADGIIHKMLCGTRSPALRTLVCFYVFFNVWLVAKLSAGL